MRVGDEGRRDDPRRRPASTPNDDGRCPTRTERNAVGRSGCKEVDPRLGRSRTDTKTEVGSLPRAHATPDDAIDRTARPHRRTRRRPTRPDFFAPSPGPVAAHPPEGYRPRYSDIETFDKIRIIGHLEVVKTAFRRTKVTQTLLTARGLNRQTSLRSSAVSPLGQASNLPIFKRPAPRGRRSLRQRCACRR